MSERMVLSAQPRAGELGQKNNVKEAYLQLAQTTSSLQRGQFHNWQLASLISAPTLCHILALDFLYQRIIDIAGNIYEFGCHVGSTSSILYQLRCQHEPSIYREFHMYDTFKGIPGHEWDYSLPNDFPDILSKVFECHKTITSAYSRPSRSYIHVGDIRETIPITNSLTSPAAMVVVDVDTPELVSHILQTMYSAMLPGTIVAIGGIGPTVPGVYLAIQESPLKGLEIRNVPGMPFMKYITVK
jgi:hypothetical protein